MRNKNKTLTTKPRSKTGCKIWQRLIVSVFLITTWCTANATHPLSEQNITIASLLDAGVFDGDEQWKECIEFWRNWKVKDVVNFPCVGDRTRGTPGINRISTIQGVNFSNWNLTNDDDGISTTAEMGEVWTLGHLQGVNLSGNQLTNLDFLAGITYPMLTVLVQDNPRLESLGPLFSVVGTRSYAKFNLNANDSLPCSELELFLDGAQTFGYMQGMTWPSDCKPTSPALIIALTSVPDPGGFEAPVWVDLEWTAPETFATTVATVLNQFSPPEKIIVYDRHDINGVTRYEITNLAQTTLHIEYLDGASDPGTHYYSIQLCSAAQCSDPRDAGETLIEVDVPTPSSLDATNETTVLVPGGIGEIRTYDIDWRFPNILITDPVHPVWPAIEETRIFLRLTNSPTYTLSRRYNHRQPPNLVAAPGGTYTKSNVGVVRPGFSSFKAQAVLSDGRVSALSNRAFVYWQPDPSACEPVPIATRGNQMRVDLRNRFDAGQWHNSSRLGHSWDFYTFRDGHMIVSWYTYASVNGQYRPIWLYAVGNGAELDGDGAIDSPWALILPGPTIGNTNLSVQVGSITSLQFNSDTSATVGWSFTNPAGIDDIRLPGLSMPASGSDALVYTGTVLGSPSQKPDISAYSGIWHTPGELTQNRVWVSEWIDGNFERLNLGYFDQYYVPTWAIGESEGTSTGMGDPIPQNTNFCMFSFDGYGADASLGNNTYPTVTRTAGNAVRGFRSLTEAVLEINITDPFGTPSAAKQINMSMPSPSDAPNMVRDDNEFGFPAYVWYEWMSDMDNDATVSNNACYLNAGDGEYPCRLMGIYHDSRSEFSAAVVYAVSTMPGNTFEIGPLTAPANHNVGEILGNNALQFDQPGFYKLELRQCATGACNGAPLAESNPFEIKLGSGMPVNCHPNCPIGNYASQPPITTGDLPGPPGSVNAATQIGSMGGSFRVDESGAATYNIPIYTVKGTAGMVPDVNLSYTSSGGLSHAGVGWSVSGTSTISRCGQTYEQDDQSRNVQFTLNDRFCMDGQRLILLPNTGSYGASGSRYRTELNSYADIQAMGVSGQGPRSFEVRMKDGTTHYFGNTEDSRIEAFPPAVDDTVYAWAENQVKDHKGNFIDYSYFEADPAAGVEYYLTRVDYTGHDDGHNPFAYIEMEYQEEVSPNIRESYHAGVKVRRSKYLNKIISGVKIGGSNQPVHDYRINYVNGGDGSGRRIVQSIKECAFQPGDGGTFCYAPTSFDWDIVAPVFGIPAAISGSLSPNKIYQAPRALDFDGDGLQDLMYAQAAGNGKVDLYLIPGRTETESGLSGWDKRLLFSNLEQDVLEQLLIFDIDGDGFQDLAYHEPYNTAGGEKFRWIGQRYAGYSQAGQYIFQRITTPLAQGLDYEPFLARAMDVNGDGRVDLMYAQEFRNLQIALNSSSGTTVSFDLPDDSSLAPPLTGYGCTVGTCERLFAYLRDDTKIFDANGDGAADLLVLVRNRNSGCGATPCRANDPGINQSAFIIAPDEGVPAPIRGSKGTVTLSVWQIFLWSHEYSRFIADQIIAKKSDCNMPVCAGLMTVEELDSSSQIFLGQINADGLADLIIKKKSADKNWYTRKNTGLTGIDVLGVGALFADPIAISGTSAYDYMQQMDIRADGFADILFAIGSSNLDRWVSFDVDPDGVAAVGIFLQNFVAGDRKGQGDTGIAFDANADGILDYVHFNYSSSGGTTVTSSYALNADPTEKINAISSITDGNGAQTFITYDRPTNSSVYHRHAGTNSAVFGEGSVVYDIVPSQLVVSKLQSTANAKQLDANSDDTQFIGIINGPALSTIFYHYEGAKVQGGGRGFLGYAGISTYDPQSSVLTRTSYRQDFPFTGQAYETERKYLTTPPPVGLPPWQVVEIPPCNLGDACFPVFPPCNSLISVCQDLMRGATPIVGELLIGHSFTEWSQAPAGDGYYEIYPSMSIEEVYSLVDAESQAVLASTVVTTTASPDIYGNTSSMSVSTYNGDDIPGNLVSQVTTDSMFIDNATDTAWQLGRLTCSKVTNSRPNSGQSDQIRYSAFLYEDTFGQLRKEFVFPELDDCSASILETLGAKQTKTYTIDAYGNRTEVVIESLVNDTDSSQATRIQTLRTVYDSATARFVNQTWDDTPTETGGQPVQLTNVATRDAYTGNPTQIDGLFGVSTYMYYDPMGREYRKFQNTGQWSQTVFVEAVFGAQANSGCPSDTVYFTHSTSRLADGSDALGADVWTCYDVLAREIAKISENFDGAQVFTRTAYDKTSKAIATSRSLFGLANDSTASHWLFNEYDAINRLVATQNPDGSSTATTYGTVSQPRAIYLTNELGQIKVQEKNALGELIKITDAAGGTIEYTYDAIGKLIEVDGPMLGTQDRVLTYYDSWGNKTKIIDPDKGTWLYRFAGDDKLICQIDAKGQVVLNIYDNFGSLATRYDVAAGNWNSSDLNLATCRTNDITGSSENTTWSYSNLAGSYRQLQSVGGTLDERKSFVYGSSGAAGGFGRLQTVYTTIDVPTSAGAGSFLTKTLEQHTSYDRLGRAWRSFDAMEAGSEPVGTQNYYNSYGYPSKVTAIADTSIIYSEILAMDALGNVTNSNGMDGLSTLTSYDPLTGRMLTKQTQQNGNILQDDAFTFDFLGNLTQRYQSGFTRVSMTEDFSYDEGVAGNTTDDLNRLTRVTTAFLGFSAMKEYIRYDVGGNIECRDTHLSGNVCDPNLSPTTNYTYGANGAGPHALTQLNSNAGPSNYSYDANGNQMATTGARARTISYTTFDKPILVTTTDGESTEFVYGVDRQRLVRIDSSSDERIVTVGRMELVYDGTGVLKNTRQNLGGTIVQRYASTSVTEFNHLITDHLGSLTAKIKGTELATLIQLSFNAWGERRDVGTGGLWPDDPLPGLTHLGFTGHQQIDHAQLIHMGGRVYDPYAGRFIQADPFVQDPTNTQSLNRYSYVLNNPLSYTDPSGFFSLKQWIRTIASIVISIYLPGAGLWEVFGAAAEFAGAVGAGFVAGAVSTGTLKGALTGAFSAGVFYGIGSKFKAVKLDNAEKIASGEKIGLFKKTGLTIGQYKQKVLAHAFAGGVMGKLNGGKFANGFVVAGVTQAFSASIDGIDAKNTDISPGRVFAAAILGGTTSVISGGKFGNGAVTAAFSRAFNDDLHIRQRRKQQERINRLNREVSEEFPSLTNALVIGVDQLGFPHQDADGLFLGDFRGTPLILVETGFSDEATKMDIFHERLHADEAAWTGARSLRAYIVLAMFTAPLFRHSSIINNLSQLYYIKLVSLPPTPNIELGYLPWRK